MNFTFPKHRITGILSVIPSKKIYFDEEMANYSFSAAKSLKLKMTMGYNAKHVVDDGVCSSDLCIYGLKYLFDNNLLLKDDIDALILVTQSPDYFMPPTSNVIQGKLGLKTDMICIDINQGCAGFVIGLFQCFMLLEQKSINKIVLLNSDILSRKVSKKDRNSNPLVGDAASVTIIEKKTDNDHDIIHGNIKTNGAAYDALIIPAGGFKRPSDEETSKMLEDTAGNFRSLDNLMMKGDEVFNFVQREVPPMIENLLENAKVGKSAIDYFMFHQPNKFILNKVADKLGVAREKMPSNIVENFGNASGVSIPTTVAYNLGDSLLEEYYNICFAGFGVGLTWASVLMKVGKLKFNKIIYF